MDSKKRIIKGAAKMFFEQGIKSVKMDDIALKLGVSKRTIYEFFGDKESLVNECVMYHYDELHHKKEELLSKADNIIEEFLLLIDDLGDDSNLNYKFMMDIRRHYPKIYDRVVQLNSEKGYPRLKSKLKEGVEDGYLLDNINYDLAVVVLAYSIYGIVTRQEMILPLGVSENDAFKYIITYFLRGVATDKGIKMIDKYINVCPKETVI